MKFYLLKLAYIIFGGQLALASDFPPFRGCHEPKPDKVAWIITVERDQTHFGYCYAGETPEHFGFPCEVDGEVAIIGSQVLGYTDFECIDIGHLPGYYFDWVPTFVAVKILR